MPKPVKAGGAKGARKVDPPMPHEAKQNPAQVPRWDRPEGDTDPYGWVERSVWTERMLECLRRGGPEGGVWYSLNDKMISVSTLRSAYARVARNGGASGVDGISVEQFGKRLEEEIARLITALRVGTYRPQAVRRTWIPKPGTDERRPLGIPTVRDRVVQTALAMTLEPIFEQTFSEHSHGFRPGRSAHGALSAVLDHLKAGKVWVVDADLKGYFDSIPHAWLLASVRRKVADRRILGLIDSFLKAGIWNGETLSEPDAGTPQGGVISPLLANIYLNDLDHLMDQSGQSMERYADDFVICCQNQAEAERALEQVRAWTAQAGLTLHPTKTRIVDLSQDRAYVDFLGFRLQRHRDKTGGDRILRLVRPKTLAKVTDAIRTQTPRKMAHGMTETISGLNRTLRGWFGYFRSASKAIHHNLDGFIRRRLRSQLCKANGMSCWGNGIAHQRWTNAFFDGLDLFSLERAHAGFINSHRGTTNRRAVCGKSARTVRREGRRG